MNHAAAIAELHSAMDRLEPEPEHTAHVALLALRLFDELAALHRLGADERVLLEGAALLHDIGWPVSKRGSGHHKHSARLIRRYRWVHLVEEEIDLMAQVARYHRKALPCSEHVDYHRLDESRRRKVRQLAAMLRLADAFDRSHLQIVRDVRVKVGARRLEFTLVAAAPPAREIAGAERKGDLAREVFERDLGFVHEPVEAPLGLPSTPRG